jgi:hypothetical protein
LLGDIIVYVVEIGANRDPFAIYRKKMKIPEEKRAATFGLFRDSVPQSFFSSMILGEPIDLIQGDFFAMRPFNTNPRTS